MAVGDGAYSHQGSGLQVPGRDVCLSKLQEVYQGR